MFTDEAIPDSVWSWPPQERAQRLRYAVVCMCAGVHPVIAWPMAFETEAEIEADIERTLELVSDEAIGEMIRSSRPADWLR